jgi:DNA-binding SARP family transcriptional activator
VRVEITLVGDVTIRSDGHGAGRTLSGAHPRIALALLALGHGQGVTRERLADAVWPDGLPNTWDSALRTAISRVRSFVRSVLPPDAPDPVVARDGRYLLRLPSGVELDVDVDAAERSLADARRALSAGDDATAYQRALDAAARLRAPFLPDHQGDWVDEQRERLSELLVASLELASRAARARGDADAALAAADEAVQRAPLRESAHRSRMAAHMAAGNRAEALKAYQRLRRALADQLGVDPDPETEAAYLDLLGPAPPPAPRPAVGEPVAPGAARPWGHRGPTDAAPFVGREAELAVLVAAWERAAAGARHVVMVTGEAGIGKTRLTTEAARRVSAVGGLVLFGRCDQEAIVPYQPLVEALDGYVSATPADQLPRLGDEALAELATVLPSIDGPRRPGGPAPRARLFEAVTALVASVAAERPVLLVLDDMQWADGDTLLLVRHLLRRAGDARLLVVAISRDHDLAPGTVLAELVHSLDRDGWVRRLPLRGLDESDVRSLLLTTGLSPRDHATLARRLVAETAGNPFLLIEMLRSGVHDPGEPIPQSVHDLVATRLGRLDAATTDLLRAAAVAGVRFELDLAAACAGLDEAATLDAIDAALGSGLVAEETPERYRFPHDIVRRTLVAQLSGARRRALHAGLADAIEAHRADRLDEYAPALAHHSSAGASPRGDLRAVRWAREAAAQARDRRALAEAVRLGRQALRHVPPGDGGLHAEVVADLARALLAAGDRAGERALVEGATLARRHGRDDVLAECALALAERAADRPELRPDATALVDAALVAFAVRVEPRAGDGDLLHARLAARRVALGGERAAEGSDEPCRDSVDQLGVPPSALAALRARLAQLAGPDHLDERTAIASDLAVLAGAVGDTAGRVAASHDRAMVAAITGDDDSLAVGLRVIGAAAAAGDPLAAATMAEFEAIRAAMAGRFGDALASVEAAAAAWGRLDGPGAAAAVARRHLAIVGWMRAEVPGSSGRPGHEDAAGGPSAIRQPPPDGDDDAEAAMSLLAAGERGLARLLACDLATGLRPLPPGDDRLHALGVLALAAADLGDAGLIEEVRARLSPYADLTCGAGYRTFAGVAAFHLGRLAALAGDWADGERHMLTALRRYSALQARPWVAFSQSLLAGILEARGRPSDLDWVAGLRAESAWATSTLGLRSL